MNYWKLKTQYLKEYIFFSSDHHFYHYNVIANDNRPFEDMYEMNHALIMNWNRTVGKKDIVFYVGDIGYNNRYVKEMKDVVHQLNGVIIFVLGNHDYIHNIQSYDRFAEIHEVLRIQIDSTKYTLSHHPFRSWNSKKHGACNLHGHEHGRMLPLKNTMDVGVPANGYAPVSLDQVKVYIDQHKDSPEI